MACDIRMGIKGKELDRPDLRLDAVLAKRPVNEQVADLAPDWSFVLAISIEEQDFVPEASHTRRSNAMRTPALIAGRKTQNVSLRRRTRLIDAQQCSLRFGLKE